MEDPQNCPQPSLCLPPTATRTFLLIFFLILLIFSLSSSLSTSARAEKEAGTRERVPGLQPPCRVGCEGQHLSWRGRGGGTLGFQPLQQPSVRLAQQIDHLHLGGPAPAALHGGRLLGLGFLRVAGTPALTRDGLDAGRDLLGAQFHPLQALRDTRWSPPEGTPPRPHCRCRIPWSSLGGPTAWPGCPAHLRRVPLLVEVSNRHAGAEAEVLAADVLHHVPAQVLGAGGGRGG